MRDEVVKAKTGRDWAGWFGALDKVGAAKLDHRAIADILSEKYGVPGWWYQMVTVEYERARGLRVPHQKAGGFSVGISKTVGVSLSELCEATDHDATAIDHAVLCQISIARLDGYLEDRTDKAHSVYFPVAWVT